MEKKKKWSIRRSELSICFWNSAECQMTGLLLVVCSMTLARRLQMHDHQSWSVICYLLFDLFFQRQVWQPLWALLSCSESVVFTVYCVRFYYQLNDDDDDYIVAILSSLLRCVCACVFTVWYCYLVLQPNTPMELCRRDVEDTGISPLITSRKKSAGLLCSSQR